MTKLANTAKGKLAAIKDQTGNVYMALEVYSEDIPTDRYWHTFPVNPESLVVAQRYLQTITPTLSGVVVDDFGRAPSPITLQGTFGLWVNNFVPPAMASRFGEPSTSRLQKTINYITTGTPANADNLLGGEVADQQGSLLDGSGRRYSGYQMAKWLKDLVDLSHKPNDNRMPRRARFYNFGLDEVYEVALNEISLGMSTQANNIWYYTLQMTVLRLLNKEERGTIPDASQLLISKGVVDDVKGLKANVQKGLERYKKIEGIVNRANRVLSRLSPGDLINYAGEYLDKQLGMPTGSFENFVTAISSLPRTIDAVANIATQVTTRLPNDVIRDYVQAKQAVQLATESVAKVSTQWPLEQGSELRSVGTSLPSIVGAGAIGLGPLSRLNEVPKTDAALVAYQDLVARSEQLVNSFATATSVAGSVIADAVALDAYSAVTGSDGTASVSVGPSVTQSVSQSVSVQQGDSLSSIAAELLGSAERWPQIAAANAGVLAMSGTGLEFGPDDDLSLLVGTVLTIPNSATVNGVQAVRDPFVYDAPVGTRILGRDWPEQLQTRPREDGTKDLLVLTPAETLAQGISERLQTPLGGISDVPQFGSTVPLLIGENFGIFTERLVSTAVKDALLKDGRIGLVRSVEVARANSGVVVDFDAQLIDGATLGVSDVAVTYDTE